MAIYLGDTEIKDCYLGDVKVLQGYLGTVPLCNTVDLGKEILNSAAFARESFSFMTGPTVTGSLRTWTVSFWMKLADTSVSGSNDDFIPVFEGLRKGTRGDYLHDYIRIRRVSDYVIQWNSTDAVGGGANFQVGSTTRHRDTSAWQHIFIAVDTNQPTIDDGLKFYINGERVVTGPEWYTQNWDTQLLNANACRFGQQSSSIGATTYATYAAYYIAEAHLVDGQQLEPTDFGYFNEVNAWVPLEYTGTHGGAGWYLEFNDAANLGLDTSGNNNDWTNDNNSVTQSKDTPTVSGVLVNVSDPRHTGNVTDVGRENSGTSPFTIQVPAGNWYYEKNGVGVQVVGPSDIVETAGSFAFLESEWVNTPPAGFQAINTTNLPDPSVGVPYSGDCDDGTHYVEGTYTGNGTVNGPFVFCDVTPDDICIDGVHYPQGSLEIVYLANGFKLVTGAAPNANGITYTYRIWGQTPFKYARARSS